MARDGLSVVDWCLTAAALFFLAVLAGQLINAPAVGCNDSLNPSGNRATALTCSVQVSDSFADLVKERDVDSALRIPLSWHRRCA